MKTLSKDPIKKMEIGGAVFVAFPKLCHLMMLFCG